MNKKLLFLAGLASLVVAPLLVVASCNEKTNDQNQDANKPSDERIDQPTEIQGFTQPDDNLEDWQKAFINLQIFYENSIHRFQTLLPSQYESVNILPPQKPQNKLGFSISMSKPDPNQNYGFRTFFKTKEINNDDEGTKMATVVLKRGKETHEANFKIKGFLTKADQQNEKENSEINPEKIIPMFNRFQFTTVNIHTRFTYIRDFLDKYQNDLDRLAIDFKESIIGFQSAVTTDLEITNLRQLNRNGLPAPEVEADFRLVSKKDPTKKSGLYTLRFSGFDTKLNGLRTEKMLEKFIKEFESFRNIIPRNDDDHYNKLKASQIQDVNHLKQIANQDLLKETIIAIPKAIKTANDAEGSLEVVFDFWFKSLGENGPKVTDRTVKVYGFKIDQSKQND